MLTANNISILLACLLWATMCLLFVLLLCACVLGCPFSQNYPLYIRSVPTQNELKFHYTVHTSLDVVEEKISAVGKSLGDQRELYLGLLYPTEDYKVYPCVLFFFKRLRVRKKPTRQVLQAPVLSFN